MLRSRILTVLAFASATLGITFEEATEAVPFEVGRPEGRFIVELDGPSNNADDAADAFRQQGLDVSINNLFDSPVFNGLSLEIRNSSAKTLDDIRALPGVKDAWQATYVTLDFQIADTNSPKWNPHALTGVDTVHENDVLGDGVNIAVIDSGVDYQNAALSGSLVKGYDFTQDPKNPTNDASDCIGHGTFVSSIIVGNSDTLVGVAPNSKVKMYKVFACSPTTTDDIILAALLKAYSENPDVISLSLGSDRGYPSIPVSLVSAKIAKTIPVVYAAGNSGSKGLYHASSGASGDGVIAVASVEANQLLSWTATLYSSTGDEKPFLYISNDGNNFNLEGYYGVDYLGDLCSASTLGGSIDGTNRIMAGFKGRCNDGDILRAANKYGYMGVILFSSQSNLKYSNLDLSGGTAKVWGVATYDPLYWMYNAASYGSNFWVYLSKSEGSSSALQKTDAYSGVINSFTSWGPTFEQGFYPHIAAPGGDVLGAKIGGGYSISSGTSFACPYITGVIALFLSANGRTDPQELRSKLIGSGKLLSKTSTLNGNTVTDKQSYAPLIQQGNGIIDAVSFFGRKTSIISEPYIELNDTTHRIADHVITVLNDGNVDINYSVSVKNLDTIFAKSDKYGNVASYYPSTQASYASVRISQTEFSLSPGAQISFNVSINPPSGLDSTKAPLFQGAIEIRGDNGESVTVPYMGVEVDTHLWTAWSDRPLIVGKDERGTLKNLTSFQHNYQPSINDSPLVYQNVRFGTKFVSFDLVLSDFNINSYQYKMKKGDQGFYGPLTTTPYKGIQIAFPVQFSDISSQISVFGFQKFSDGTKIPNGTFRILCRALKPFGAYETFDDWQLYLSDPFTVNEGH